MKVDGVDVFVHWSVFVISGFILLQAFRRPGLSFVGLLCYLGVLLIHETGHMVAARRRGCNVDRIELYPIFGITYFSAPWSRFDHQLIAWSGVAAQAIIAVPLIIWVVVFGYTRFDTVNAALAILGFFSLGVAIFNLLPFRPLDGATAWGLIPELVKRARVARTDQNRRLPRR